MTWEAVSGVSGVISAVVAVFSLVGIRRGYREKATPTEHHLATLSLYLLFCSGWVLLVIAYNWCFAPFGNYLFPADQKKLYGIMLIVPAFVLTLYAARRLFVESPESKKSNDEKA